jgi:hypothetical protein
LLIAWIVARLRDRLANHRHVAHSAVRSTLCERRSRVELAERAGIAARISNAAAIAGVIAIAVSGFAQDTRAQVPSVDIEQTCHNAADAMVGLLGGSTARNDYEICLNSEKAAREQLEKDWANFSAADKAQCLQSRVYLPSYVEWQTCMQMERDVRTLRGNTPAPSATAPVTMPTVPPAINDAPPVSGPTTVLTLPTVASGINDERPVRGSAAPIQLPTVQPSVHD